MFEIDFSKPIDLLKLPQEEEWQKNIVYFLEEWYNVSDLIITKTSGSTGEPKNIKLQKSAMEASATMTGEFLNLRCYDTALLCMPSLYIAGKMMLVRAIIWKLKLCCVEPTSNPLKNLNQHFIFSAMTPMQVENSLSKITNIKKLIIGGAQISSSLRIKLKRINTDVYESFGMTETISHIALKKISGNQNQDDFQTLPNTQIRLDERGCLCISTSFLDKEIITNDLVSITSENTFEWLGRIDNVINSGGVKIFPEKVEDQLRSIIKNQFIISSEPHVILGQSVILIIEGKVDHSLELKISNFNFQNKYEKPRKIYYIESFNRTPTGKIIRKIKLGM